MAFDLNEFFGEKLYDWHKTINRPLPWKEESDPYVIWLAEIILQQTRVEYGKQYFEKFKNTFPTIYDLAAASEDEVLNLWQGLGYYSRARNLHYSARYIANNLDGKFPNTYDDMLQLKGVGPYTASAIASFAFRLPHVVVDGNVYRILSRFFGVEEPVDTAKGKKTITDLANDLLDHDRPDAFNQAVMDFGALQCKPAAPQCSTCPLQAKCVAYRQNKVHKLPVKSRKHTHKHRYFNYFVFYDDSFTYLQRRSNQDIWKNLYEFPLLETKKPPKSFASLKNSLVNQFVTGDKSKIECQDATLYNQTLSHQKIHARFFDIPLQNGLKLNSDGEFFQVPKNFLEDFAFPRVICWYLRSKHLYL